MNVRRHRFDATSAALGLLTIAIALLVVTGAWPSGAALGWLAIAGVIAIAVAVIPWGMLLAGDREGEGRAGGD